MENLEGLRICSVHSSSLPSGAETYPHLGLVEVIRPDLNGGTRSLYHFMSSHIF